MTPDVLIGAVRAAGEQLMALAAEVERELAHDVAVRRGQLVLLERDATEAGRAVERRIMRYVAEVLEPLERLLGPTEDIASATGDGDAQASAAGYLHDQDGIQKRMIWDLQEQVRTLRAQVAALRSMLVAGPPRTAN